MIPSTSPITEALIATPAAIRQEQETLKKRIRALVPQAESVLEKLGDLSVLNPTQEQREYIVNHLMQAISRLQARYDSVKPRQAFLLPLE